MEKYTTSITTSAPFDFDLTASFATNFQERSSVNTYIDGVFSRLLDISGSRCLTKVSSPGKEKASDLNLEIKADMLDDPIISEAKKQATRLLGFDQDLKPFYLIAEKEPLLRDLIRQFRGLHLPQTASVWEGLVSVILGQQISAQVAKLLRLNLVRKYGAAVTDDDLTHYAFPEPEVIENIGVEGLLSIKLSRNKSKYIVDIAREIVSGRLDLEKLHDQPDKDIFDFLTNIRGIGPWSANWLLIQAYERPDAFPAGDLILRRMLDDLIGEETSPLTPAAAMRISQRWSPFRSYVTTYLFAAVRTGLFSK